MLERTWRRGLAGIVGVGSLLVGAEAWADPPAAPDPAAGAQPAATTAAPAPSGPISTGPLEEVKHEDKDKLAPNSVFAEGLGAGLLYSINYERMVIDQLGVRIGLTYLSYSASASAGSATSSSSATYLFIPVTASYVGIRSGKSALELGGGATFLYASGAASGTGVATSGSGIVPMGVAMVGYRLQPVDHPGFMFRVGAMALGAKGLAFSSNDPEKFGVIPWGYISFGASF